MDATVNDAFDSRSNRSTCRPSGWIGSSTALLCLSLLLLLLTAGCEKNTPTTAPETAEQLNNSDMDLDQAQSGVATEQLWRVASESLNAIESEARNLSQAISTFLDQPTPANLTSAQQKWRSAYFSYQGFYFYSQLAVTEAEVFAPLVQADFYIGAEPIQPGYLDYFGDYPYAGLVHDISVPLNPESLIKQHGMTDAEEIVLGLHAIEFMLFGENGSRPPIDYLELDELTTSNNEQGYNTVNELPNNRRRALLQTQANQLTTDIEGLHNAWENRGIGSIHSNWQDLTPSEQVLTIRKAFERTVTQLLLKTVASSTAANAATESSETETNAATDSSGANPQTNQNTDLPFQLLSNSQLAQALANAVASLKGCYLYLPETTGATITAELERAHHQLEQSSASGTPIDWSQVYQAIKDSSEAYQTR